MSKKALIIVDLQNDFCPGGSLAVPEGDQIVSVVNRLIDKFMQTDLPIFATRDWHPANHCSFQAQGGPWPPHCVKNTKGAEFHPDSRLPEDVTIISKATTNDRDAYSGFEGTELAEHLRNVGSDNIVICGLATDYCVKATALDGIKEDLRTIVVKDAIRGVNIQPDDSEKAIFEMQQAGIIMIFEADLTI